MPEEISKGRRWGDTRPYATSGKCAGAGKAVPDARPGGFARCPDCGASILVRSNRTLNLHRAG